MKSLAWRRSINFCIPQCALHVGFGQHQRRSNEPWELLGYIAMIIVSEAARSSAGARQGGSVENCMIQGSLCLPAG